MTTRMPITTPNMVQLQEQLSHAWTVITGKNHQVISKQLICVQHTRKIGVSIYLFVCLSVCLRTWRPGCLSVCPSVSSEIQLACIAGGFIRVTRASKHPNKTAYKGIKFRLLRAWHIYPYLLYGYNSTRALTGC